MRAQIFFTPDDLVQRWHISPRTLERSRWLGSGPPFIKVGAKVLYRITDIEAFESEGARTKSSERNKRAYEN